MVMSSLEFKIVVTPLNSLALKESASEGGSGGRGDGGFDPPLALSSCSFLKLSRLARLPWEESELPLPILFMLLLLSERFRLLSWLASLSSPSELLTFLDFVQWYLIIPPILMASLAPISSRKAEKSSNPSNLRFLLSLAQTRLPSMLPTVPPNPT
eukprot:CAMPEP_0118668928 /NCGR_PEP_ID=MMETSP0785-20121206/20617_1 /TAXON_ID=91992 /ORGANISM="Bolidomonas pacifica, Strain CCMP 1866" /LENGTH=155 /DNA_ID=CAMNT_0006563553 /DNA_START=438 /DNA_END=901 /DNA_ORIENTATION=-